MRVKLQLVICNDVGHEETVTDVITLNKNTQRIEHLELTLAESKQLQAPSSNTSSNSKSTPFSIRMRCVRIAVRLCV